MDLKTSFSGIFESLLAREPLFREKDVLRHSYTPEVLPHREREVRLLASVLAPVLRGDTPSNILIYGKSGTGKSITSRFICGELHRTGVKMGIPVDTVFLNCEVTDTQYRVLQCLAKEFGERVPFTGWPTDKVYRTFVDAIDRRRRYVIIVLDEVDRLVANSGDSVIYNLTRINGELKNARVSIVGISNDLKFTSFLDARVQSSLSGEEIVFSPYDAGQLEDILEQRAGLAFKPGVLDEFVVGLCAALAAREHGDARRALDLLRVSGEIAEREGSERVVEGHVRRAKEKIETDHVVEAVRTLPTQSKLVLYAVVLLDEAGGGRRITTGDVYALYGRLCGRVGLDVLTSRRVSDLVLELDLLGILDTVVVSKGRYGRSREIVLDVPAVGIRLVLEDDVRLRSLIDYKAPQRTLK